ncbi:hypothetical protein BTA51_16595 [Hahella sp. CCB-MM4]|nr:hypothetical protein BTA51_16595 [Hahella sp. CCB-MM4]
MESRNYQQDTLCRKCKEEVLIYGSSLSDLQSFDCWKASACISKGVSTFALFCVSFGYRHSSGIPVKPDLDQIRKAGKKSIKMNSFRKSYYPVFC